MIKSIIKEFFIGIGLCLIIALLAAIMFYSYIPANKPVPTIESYERSDALEEELTTSAASINEIQQQSITYDIGKSDLRQAQSAGDFDSGKPNPFAVAPTGDVSGNNSGNNTGNSTNNNNTGSSTTGNNTNNNDRYSDDPNAK